MTAPLILLVDDDPDEHLLGVLRGSSGCRFHCEHSPTTANYFLDSHSDVTAVVTDLYMPGEEDGWGFIRDVRTKWPSMRVVLRSYVGLLVAEKAIQLGVFDIIEKGSFMRLRVGEETLDHEAIVSAALAPQADAGRQLLRESITLSVYQLLEDLLKLDKASGVAIERNATAGPGTAGLGLDAEHLASIWPALKPRLTTNRVTAFRVEELAPTLLAQEDWKADEHKFVVAIPFSWDFAPVAREVGCILVFSGTRIRLTRKRLQSIAEHRRRHIQSVERAHLLRNTHCGLLGSVPTHTVLREAHHVPERNEPAKRENGPHDLVAALGTASIVLASYEKETTSSPAHAQSIHQLRHHLLEAGRLARTITAESKIWKPSARTGARVRGASREAGSGRWGARVLVIDDRRVDREASQAFLESLNYTVVSASSADQALGQPQLSLFDAYLVDMRLARGEEGIELAEDLRTRGIDAPIIMMSAFSTVTAAVRALKAGVDDFIVKDEHFESTLEASLARSLASHAMANSHQDLVEELWTRAQAESDSHQKGRLLETLMSRLFESVPFFRVVGQNVRTITEEVDVIVAMHSRDSFWANYGSHFLVECKNYRRKVGKNEALAFEDKLTNRYGATKLGFIVALGGVAKTFALHMLRSSSRPPLVVPLDHNDISDLVKNRNRELLLRGLVDRAISR